MRAGFSRKQIVRAATVIGGICVIGVILWIDIATGFWQNLVILSGLAAGLVTFILTVLVLDRVMARSTARRWAPLTRVALTDFLHAIVDDQESEISRGLLVPRTLVLPNPSDDNQTLATDLHLLREQLVDERRALSDSLSRWAEFLASSGDNETVLRHVAGIALRLDLVRDATFELEHAVTAEDPVPGHTTALTTAPNRAALATEIETCNAHFAALVDELRRMINDLDRASEQ